MTAPYLAVGCYGKLPMFRDFVSENANLPTAQTFKRWLHQGRTEAQLSNPGVPAEEWLPEDPRRRPETFCRRFLFGIPGSVDLMAGVIRPSADERARARFPFAVFAHFPRRTYGKHYGLLPLGLAPVWDALDSAWDNLSMAASDSAFREMVKSALIPPPAELDQVRTEFRGSQSEGTGRIFEAREGTSVDALLANLPDVLRGLRSGPEQVRMELPVTVKQEIACYDAAFWIELVNHQFLLKRFEPSVFLDTTPGRQDRSALLFFGPLADADYPLVMGCEGEPNAVSRPATGKDGAPAAHGELTYGEILARKLDT